MNRVIRSGLALLVFAPLFAGAFSRLSAQDGGARLSDISIFLPSHHLGMVPASEEFFSMYLVRAGVMPDSRIWNVDYRSEFPTSFVGAGDKRVVRHDFKKVVLGDYSEHIEFGTFYHGMRLPLGTISVSGDKPYLLPVPPLVPIEIHIPFVKDSVFDPERVVHIEISGAQVANSWFLATRGVEFRDGELITEPGLFPAGQTFKVRVLTRKSSEWWPFGEFKTNLDAIQSGKVTAKKPAK